MKFPVKRIRWYYRFLWIHPAGEGLMCPKCGDRTMHLSIWTKMWLCFTCGGKESNAEVNARLDWELEEITQQINAIRGVPRQIELSTEDSRSTKRD